MGKDPTSRLNLQAIQIHEPQQDITDNEVVASRINNPILVSFQVGVAESSTVAFD